MSAERGAFFPTETIRPFKTYPKEEVPSVERTTVFDLFADLPVEPGTNLQYLQGLADAQPIDKQKVIDRYLDIINIRKKHGPEGQFNITLQTAFTLIHDETFKSVVEETKELARQLHTARHEIDHVNAAYFMDWNVDYVSIIPAADYLGVTGSSPKKQLSMYDWCIESGTISIASVVGAKMRGEPPLGCGSDIASAHAKARLAHEINPEIAEEAIFSQMCNYSHMALKAAGGRGLENQSQVLAYKKVA